MEAEGRRVADGESWPDPSNACITCTCHVSWAEECGGVGVFEVIRKERPLGERGQRHPVLGTELRAGLQASLEQEVVVLEQLQGEGAAASERRPDDPQKCDQGPQVLPKVPKAAASVLSGAAWSATTRSARPSPAHMAG